jgi:hypothetical protein
MRFSLIRFRSPLLTESRLLSLPVGTEMFHFPTFPPRTLCVQVRVTGHDSCRVSPFGHPRITARLAAPRGLSQPPTSFFGSWCQGIHRAPLLTWPQRCSRPLCSSQGTGGPGRGPVACTDSGAVRRTTGPDPSVRTAAMGRVRSRCQGGAVPTPSGPNSVPTVGSMPGHAFHAPQQGQYSRGDHRSGRTGQRSTHEHRVGMHIRSRVWTARGPPGAP